MASSVLITRHPDNRYTARALALPDVVVSGATKQEAIANLRASLQALQAHNRVVQVELLLPSASDDNPWLRQAGIWEHDPDWDAFEAEVAAYRNEIDARFQPE